MILFTNLEEVINSMAIGKVTAFIAREKDNTKEILVLQHPYAGIQFPSGTIEANETVEEALMREIYEETGLNDIEIKQYIGSLESKTRENEYLISEKSNVYSRPDLTSFNWVNFRKGITVTSQRSHVNFTQVTYIEYDKFPHPKYITYQITGWVPTRILAKTSIQHFFHVWSNEAVQEEWEVFGDNHKFKLFWVSLSKLPVIVGYQLKWYNYVVKDIGYTF